MRQAEKEKQEAIEQLRKWLKPGDTVYTVLRHVSRSGMQREISLYVIKDGEPQWLDGWASKALGERIGKREGLVVGGCGMDMGFHLVYNLSRTLWPDGFGCVGDRVTVVDQYTAETCPGDHSRWPACDHKGSHTARQACPSNDHSNGDRDYTPHCPREYGRDPETPERVKCAECGRETPATFVNAKLSSHVCEQHAMGSHWHRDGGYALRQRWI